MPASLIHREGTKDSVRALLFLIIFCFAGMFFVSCSEDEPEDTDDTEEEENKIPTITAAPDSDVNEGDYTSISSAVIVTVTATDEDNDTPIYSIKEQGTPFTIDANGIITATRCDRL